MRKQMALVGGMLSLALVTVLAQPPDIGGTWNMTFNTDQGSQSATLTLEQDGETFSGSVSGEQGDLAFEGGTITGNAIEWVLEIDAGGQFLEIAVEGTVDGDEMSGSIDFGGYGGGDWTATRGG
mgnify:CR=1 FL=1